jgi:hypothetical protein
MRRQPESVTGPNASLQSPPGPSEAGARALQALDELVLATTCGVVAVHEQDAASAERSITHGDPASSPVLVVSPDSSFLSLVWYPRVVPMSTSSGQVGVPENRKGPQMRTFSK